MTNIEQLPRLLTVPEVAELLDRFLAEDAECQCQLGEQLAAVEKALEDAAAQMTKAEQREKAAAALKAAEDAEKETAAQLEQRQAALEAERGEKAGTGCASEEDRGAGAAASQL